MWIEAYDMPAGKSLSVSVPAADAGMTIAAPLAGTLWGFQLVEMLHKA